MSCDYAVSVIMGLVHSEIGAAVLNEHVVLLEAAFVEEHGNPFPRRVFPFLMLGIDSFLTSAHARFGPALYKFFDFFLLDTHNIM